MNWWWLIGAALLGVAALSVYAAFQSPEFTWGLISVMLVAAYHAIAPIITKRMTPEQEAKWRKSTRLPDGDDAFNRKRRGAPPKG